MPEKEWNLYEDSAEKQVFLEPLKFSNGKNQQDVVDEVISEIEKGSRIIFIKGVCGTGKSAVALNIAKKLGKASIVVPIKNLQKQYEEDYTSKKYVLKNGKKLKISLITGRNNHKCPFLQENKALVEGLSEKNTTLDIFDKEPAPIKNDKSCDNPNLPCKIEIKFRNLEKLREYLNQNEKVNPAEFSSVQDIKRMSIAPICKYWSPIIPADVELRILDDAKKLKYNGLNNIQFIFYKRKSGCGYYDQFDAYLNSDVLIFNSLKYQLETVMNRKPATDVEIIDECDEFLDSFSNVEKININLLSSALLSVYSFDSRAERIIQNVWKIKDSIMKDKSIDEKIENDEIIPIKETKVYELLKLFLEEKFVNSVELDEENYCYNVDEVAQIFKNFFDETYVSYIKDGKDLIVNLVTTNLEERFKELVKKNKVLILMSGTIHSEKVLKEIFGILKFKIVDAETKMPGKIDFVKTGLEINCKYDNFIKGKVTRKQYLLALEESVKRAEKPCLIHVHSFADLPDEEEAEKLGLSIISRKKLKEIQKDNSGELIKMFKERKIPVLYSTKASRGVDFPGKICNSIILTKYPYPGIKGMFWRVLKKTRPQHYNEFYLDKARREFLQRLYRGLRSNEDHIYLLSPDSRVFENVKNSD